MANRGRGHVEDLRSLVATQLPDHRVDANDVVALRERADFYARCSVMEDLAYGIETGKGKYVDKSLAAMVWLFPAQDE